jgi:hypothetical protein
MGKLTDLQIEEYFEKHLPYRNRIMLAHKRIAIPENNIQLDILQACFEASLITGRMYLNVLGIGKQQDKICRMNFRPDDVSAEDLGGNLVDIKKLDEDIKSDLLNFIIMSDKGAAHLTTPKELQWDKTHQMIELIEKLVMEYIYKPTGRTFKT